jgi:hypothetical protein
MRTQRNLLNVPLFNALCEIYGEGNVYVTNEGVEGELVTAKKDGKMWATKCRGGEQYYVNCPACGDTRHRLYIAHWAFKNVQKGKSKVYTNALFFCQNEQKRPDVRDLREKIANIIKLDDVQPASVPANRGRKKKKLELPEGCIPVNEPDAPIAVQDYLRSRGFDLDILANGWNVYAVEHLEAYPYHGPKIIYPVLNNGELAFWQARLAWDPTKEQQKAGAKKYYFPPGSNKSEYLYNKDMARKQDVVVIVEGVTDAQRVGSIAVALFGKVPSMRQTQIMHNALGHSTGIMLLDEDAKEEAYEYFQRHEKDLFHRGFGFIGLEKGDPADYTREELWDMINKEVLRIRGGLK